MAEISEELLSLRRFPSIASLVVTTARMTQALPRLFMLHREGMVDATGDAAQSSAEIISIDWTIERIGSNSRLKVASAFS